MIFSCEVIEDSIVFLIKSLHISGMRSRPDVHISAISLSPLTLLSDPKQYSGSTHGVSLRNIVPLGCSDVSHEEKTFYFLY